MNRYRPMALIIIAVCLCLSFAAFAQDDLGELSVTYTAQPVSMVVPEEILVRLTLVFDNTDSIGNIRICREDGTIIANVNKDNITSGQPYVMSDTMIPTERQLNNGMVVYSVRYTEGFGMPSAYEREESVVIALEKLPAVPGIDFTRLAPYTVVSPGVDTGIIYRVHNTGNVAITNLYVSDAIAGEIARVDRLEPGERVSFVKQINISQNAVSIPKIVYSHAATSDSFTEELAPTSIAVALEDLKASLTCDAYETVASSTVKLTCTVRNNGNVSYSRIVVDDETLGTIPFPSSEIPPGEERSFTKTVPIKGDSRFRFTVNALCETGREISIDSNEVAIKVNPETYANVDLSLAASVVSESDSSVTVELNLTNSGPIALKNIRVSERNRGIFKTLYVVPTGITTLSRKLNAVVGDKLAFMAEITDNTGGVLTVMSNEILLDGSAPRPPDDHEEVLPPLLDKIGSESMKVPDVYYTYTNMILLASLVLLILLMIAVIVFVSRRRELRRREDEHTKTIRRNLMRAGASKDDTASGAPNAIAVHGNRHSDKKNELMMERDRKPGSI